MFAEALLGSSGTWKELTKLNWWVPDTEVNVETIPWGKHFLTSLSNCLISSFIFIVNTILHYALSTAILC
jgi:hypothetical protein